MAVSSARSCSGVDGLVDDEGGVIGGASVETVAAAVVPVLVLDEGGPLVSPAGGRGGIDTVKGSIFGKNVELISPIPTKKSSGTQV